MCVRLRLFQVPDTRFNFLFEVDGKLHVSETELYEAKPGPKKRSLAELVLDLMTGVCLALKKRRSGA